MNIKDHEVIRLHHGVEHLRFSQELTDRRIRECQQTSYREGRCQTAKKAATRKLAVEKPLTATMWKVLNEFPPQGIPLAATLGKVSGRCSNALLFARGLGRYGRRDLAAVIALIRLGYLGIAEGYCKWEGDQIAEILCRLEQEES